MRRGRGCAGGGEAGGDGRTSSLSVSGRFPRPAVLVRGRGQRRGAGTPPARRAPRKGGQGARLRPVPAALALPPAPSAERGGAQAPGLPRLCRLWRRAALRTALPGGAAGPAPGPSTAPGKGGSLPERRQPPVPLRAARSPRPRRSLAVRGTGRARPKAGRSFKSCCVNVRQFRG